MNPRRAVFLDHPSLDLGDLDLSPLRACFSDLQLFAQTLPNRSASACRVPTWPSPTRSASTPPRWPPTPICN
ncbi:hypothetical protein V5O39_30045 [Pseudomonas parakoreensis]